MTKKTNKTTKPKTKKTNYNQLSELALRMRLEQLHETIEPLIEEQSTIVRTLLTIDLQSSNKNKRTAAKKMLDLGRQLDQLKKATSPNNISG